MTNDGIENAPASQSDPKPAAAPKGFRDRLFYAEPWLAFSLPLIMFMLAGALEPQPPVKDAHPGWFDVEYSQYPMIYSIKIALVVAAVAFCWPVYREFAGRVSLLAIGIGLVGGAVWIGVCSLELEKTLLPKLGLWDLALMARRSSFNPMKEMADQPLWAYVFLAVRMFGLVVAISIAEEFFLRGFLMRAVVKPEWEEVPFGFVNVAAAAVGTIVPLLMHPGEIFAAAIWFSTITWLSTRTRSIWDCVAAHATTNLVIGVHAIVSGDWSLV